MSNLKSNEQRAKNAILLIWIVFALEIISLISSYFQYDLLSIVANGGEISIDTAEANDTREQIIGIISIVLYLISIVTFIQWFRRAYFNLHQKISDLTYSEGWAAGAWFVPIINLFRPYQIMNELYEKTRRLFLVRGVNTNLSTNFLGIWWALRIINLIAGQFVYRYSMKAEFVDEVITATIASMILNIVGIVLALITVRVIRDYAKEESLLLTIDDND